MRLIIFLLFASFTASAQVDEDVLYVEEGDSYSLLINQETKVHKQFISGSHVETFVFTQNNQFKYTLTVLRSKANNMTNDSLFTYQYEQAYMDNCGCEVLSSTESKVDNINSLLFKIKRKENNMVLLGYADSFVVNEILFNVVFMIPETNFLSYQSEYSSIKNSFDIRQ